MKKLLIAMLAVFTVQSFATDRIKWSYSTLSYDAKGQMVVGNLLQEDPNQTDLNKYGQLGAGLNLKFVSNSGRFANCTNPASNDGSDIVLTQGEKGVIVIDLYDSTGAKAASYTDNISAGVGFGMKVVFAAVDDFSDTASQHNLNWDVSKANFATGSVEISISGVAGSSDSKLYVCNGKNGDGAAARDVVNQQNCGGLVQNDGRCGTPVAGNGHVKFTLPFTIGLIPGT